MGRKAFVIGVGMTKFEKPGSKEWDYPDMAREAGTKCIEDAGIAFEDIEQAAVGYCYGDSTAGERAFYELGHSGIPIYNVNNNCSTGSTALFMAKQFVEGDIADQEGERTFRRHPLDGEVPPQARGSDTLRCASGRRGPVRIHLFCR